jgi:hypothetical protein
MKAPRFHDRRRANRDVLQIGIAAAQMSGDRLIERRAHAPGGRIHSGQRVDLRPFQLLNAAPLEHERRHLVHERGSDTSTAVDTTRVFGLLAGLQIQLNSTGQLLGELTLNSPASE